MPRVTIRTGFFTPDGREEELSEFLCDAPGCSNVATHVAGCVRELGLAAVLCEEHAAARGASNAADEATRESSE
jgi:hypothetical protein